MALGTTNISTTLVGTTLGTSSRDVGTLCTHSAINKWSRYKPVNGEYLHPTCGFIIPYTTNQRPTDLRQTTWTYDKPQGGVQSPYRLGDFRQYDHNVKYADSAFGIGVSYPTVGGTLSISCTFGQLTSNLLASPRYMPKFTNGFFGVSVFKGDVLYDMKHVISKCGVNAIGSNSGELIQIDTSAMGFVTGEILMVIPFIVESTFNTETGISGGAGNGYKYNLNAVAADSATVLKNIGTPLYPFYFSNYVFTQAGSYGLKVDGKITSQKETNTTSLRIYIQWQLYSELNGGGTLIESSSNTTIGFFDIPRFGTINIPQYTISWNTVYNVKSVKVRYIIDSLTDTYQVYNMQ